MNNSFIDRVNAIVQQNQSTDPAYPDAGIGALENVANNVPRQAQLMNQPHMLAYINPQEEQMLRDMGGAGLPGPDGIPVYGHGGFHFTDTSSVREYSKPILEALLEILPLMFMILSALACPIRLEIRDTLRLLLIKLLILTAIAPPPTQFMARDH